MDKPAEIAADVEAADEAEDETAEVEGFGSILTTRSNIKGSHINDPGPDFPWDRFLAITARISGQSNPSDATAPGGKGTRAGER